MLDRLASKFEEVFKKLRGRGVLSENEIDAALKEVRLALLEADVHFKVVKAFLDSIRAKALGREVLESLTPAQQVVKIVWEELRGLMADESGAGPAVSFTPGNPVTVMLVGLQGAGKTTTAAKLAARYRGEGRRVLLGAADPRRPAAAEQLKTLGRHIGVETVAPSGGNAVSACREAVARARSQNDDLVILDTGGRLHIDEDLMAELKAIRDELRPQQVFLVADAMAGQDAVRMAEQFHRDVGLSGVILTKTDGDARGGAILSIRAVTGVPVRFIGTGEKIDGLEPFHPDRMASRILGMGDVLSLIERAQAVSAEPSEEGADVKGTPGAFSLEDFRDQLRKVRKLGSMESILGMLPGGARLRGALPEGEDPERSLVRSEAIINSMTIRERRHPERIDGSRRKRIAKGSGTTVQDVNRLLKQFRETQKMMKMMKRFGPKAGLAKLLRFG